MTPSADGSSEFERLVDEFLTRARAGEAPEAEEYAARYPNLAAEIRQVFPTLRMLEEFGSVTDARRVGVELTAPRQLGEYLVLREVGRGGMGVVYEAVQQSLGRHVALKVLSPGLHRGAAEFERFRREAQAAARLHHTNIVPVFAVGQEDGTHFYAMQFIRGQSLAAVLDELRGAGSRSPATTALLTEQAAPLPSDSAIALPSQSGRAEYFRNVARLGAAVADALHHAHQAGVIHRDVKPSNLLLDQRGVVWVTDFGLAKAAGTDDLTNTGDILGTLVYMAPEQLTGHADARTDIYSLGATLYEMITLRPPFRDEVRVRLVERVRSETPSLPRSIDSLIPRDLETVVLKAMAKEATDRYATAAELADDLLRFASGRAVRARRASWAGQAWRWCKRNPMVAGLLATVFGLLLAIVAVLAVSATESRELNADLSKALADAKTAQSDLRDTLWQARVAEANASRWSNRGGRRFEALAAIGEAAEIRYDPILRDEAVSSLSLADVAPDRTILAPGWTSLPDRIDFTPDLEHFVRPDATGLSVRRTSDDVQVAHLPRGDRIPIVCRFSPDGRRLAVRYEQGKPQFQVWDWRAVRVAYELPDGVPERAFDFSPDGRTLAVVHHKAFRFVDLTTEPRTTPQPIPGTAVVVRFDPTGKRAAVTAMGDDKVRIFEAATGTELPPLQAKPDSFGLAWSPDGNTLAVGLWADVLVFHPAESTRPVASLTGRPSGHHDLVWHPAGKVLAGHSTSGLTTVWDTATRRQLLELEGHANRFSGDGNALSFRGGGRIGIWKVATGAEAAALGAIGLRLEASFATFLDRWDLLATSGPGGIHLWDLTTQDVLGQLPVRPTFGVRLDPVGPALVVAESNRVARWPIHEEPAAGGVRLTVGPPLPVPLGPPQKNPYSIALSGDGTRGVVSYANSNTIVVTGRDGEPQPLTFHPQTRFVDVSRDGRRLAVGRYEASGFGVWDLPTGKLTTLYRDGGGPVAFSPGGRTLATCEGVQLTLWDADTGTQIWAVPRPDTVGGMAVAFSPDGSVLAYTHDRTRVRLIDPVTREVFATLTPTPAPVGVVGLTFSADGSRLAIASGTDGVRVWDLAAIRRQLRPLGLDWKLPVLTPSPPASKVVEVRVSTAP